MSLTKKLFSRTKNHTIMPNCGAPVCRNQSITHPEKSFHRLPGLSKKEWGTRGYQKLLLKELFICSDHFEPECFKRDLKVRFGFSEKKYFGHFNEKGY